jgi:cytochrome P450
MNRSRMDGGSMSRGQTQGQLAFGFGRHTCLGAHLANLEMQSILKAMVAPSRIVRILGIPFSCLIVFCASLNIFR